MKTNIYNKDFALNLALKYWLKGTREWLIAASWPELLEPWLTAMQTYRFSIPVSANHASSNRRLIMIDNYNGTAASHKASLINGNMYSTVYFMGLLRASNF